VDVKLGPDGALYIADFYNCIIGHYEVPLTHPRRDRERGRIWRITYKGDGSHSYKPPVPEFARASVPELVDLLGHVNPTVRIKATNQLVSRGQAVRPGVENALGSPSAFTRQHALWILERLGGADAGQLARAASDAEPQVRLAAARILAERKTLEPGQDALLVRSLEDADPTVRRNAAEALGQHPSAAHVQPLLAAWRGTPADDTQLVHALRIALRNQLLPAETWTELRSIPLTEDDVRKLADVSLGVRSPQAADFLMTHLGAKALERMNRARNVHHIARQGTPETVKTLLAFVQADRPDDLGHQSSLLRGFLDGTQERGQRLSGEARPWAESVTTRLLDATDARLLQTGLELASALKPAGAMPRLREIALDGKQDENRRVTAFNALVALDAQAQIPALGEALANASEPITLREKVVGVLAGINSAAARAELLKNLPTAPARLQTVLAVGLAGNREGAEALLDAIAAGKASARLLQERVVEARLKASQPPKLDERVALLTRGLPPVDERLQQVLNQRRGGFLSANADPAKGAKVFEQHCAGCHQLQNKGAKVGPQLDGIGIRGLDRLLEDLVDPNRNVDQAFRASLLLRTDGQLVQGLVLREEGAVLVLADDKGKEVRISSAEIAERKVSTLSPMPANLLEQVPEKDFYDLLAYLLSQRDRPPQPPQGSSGP
jgi:putative heme-binding domain-containing protein